ncbi:3,4-dihydroxy-2-butanone-4-phosphate synthase [Amycolatopsis sp. CA-230715]|uniref:3,4-dihydroxy-2-butanone-4-phosphate synthase n=1 Tax=Amycolatopsis sp. CA-230715 TaxID=2745196 RepID=UPI001C029CDC|nr:3,4-dihydroxy-2-butanone-4-phosphate synthase [Amycolatopsis sp. CA-230715]QWF82986.1 Riboflavin biosynthesis protein RibBA [Amycolatopsis sp. CA-230715]
MTAVAPPRTSVETALESLRAGRPVLVVDEENLAHQGEVVLAAAVADVAQVAWTVRHTSGLLCAALRDDRADRLGLPLMVPRATDRPACTVSVDAAEGNGTGISATDRARTARILADPGSVPDDLRRPGHLLGLRVDAGGVLARRGYGEAAADLCELADLPPVGLTAALVDGHGLADAGYAAELGRCHGIPVVAMADLIVHRTIHNGLSRRDRGESVSTPHGRFTAYSYREAGTEHLALVAPGRARSVAVHVECTAGDLFGSGDCACRARLDRSLAEAARHGGVVVYLRGMPAHRTAMDPALAPVTAAILADLEYRDHPPELGLDGGSGT